MSSKNNNLYFFFALLIALANLGLFTAMFVAMGYYELIGADPSYFDEGTLNNIKIINSITDKFGLHIDPTKPHKISTLGFAFCLGFALVSSGFAITIANRQKNEVYEVTDAK